MNNSGKPLFLLSVGCCLLSTVFMGCDKIFPKKPSITAPVATSQIKAPEVKGTVVATVNNRSITLEELNAEIDSFNAYVPAENLEAKIDTRDKKVSYLRSDAVRKILLYQAALDKGLERKEEVQKAMDNFKQNLLVSELVREETAGVEPTSKEIEDYYNSAKDQLKEPEERQIREIVVSDEVQAKDILIELLKGADFIALAQQRSITATAKDGGDLGYVKKDGKNFPLFEDNAFSSALEVGKVSNYFKGPSGYYILKLEAKREGKAKSLAELRDDIKKGLTFLKQQQKMEELLGKLTRDAKIEINESLIK